MKMNRRLLINLFVTAAVLVAALGLAPVQAFAAGTPTITIPPVQGNPGSTVTLSVNIDSQGVLTRGYGITLYFDPTKFTIVSVTGPASKPASLWGAMLDGSTCTDPNADLFQKASKNVSAGTVTLGEAVLGCATPSTGAVGLAVKGTLATIQLQILSGTANGKYLTTDASGTTPKILDTSGNPISGAVFAYNFVRVGAAPALAIQSIVFSPASGSSSTTATVTLINNGAAMAVPGDDTTFTLSMDSATPATQTFVVSGLGAGATTTLTQAYSVTGSKTDLTVTDPDFSISQTATYFAAVTSSQSANVDATIGVTIALTTNGTINFHPLSLGLNQQYAGMTVTSDAQKWTVNAAMDYWNLTEWNPVTSMYISPNPYSLHQPLQIFCYRHLPTPTLEPGNPLTSNSVLISDGVIANQTADSGEAYDLTYQQIAHVYDAAVAPHSYHGIVTYTAAVSF
jgi:hypothetical protein